MSSPANFAGFSFSQSLNILEVQDSSDDDNDDSSDESNPTEQLCQTSFCFSFSQSLSSLDGQDDSDDDDDDSSEESNYSDHQSSVRSTSPPGHIYGPEGDHMYASFQGKPAEFVIRIFQLWHLLLSGNGDYLAWHMVILFL